MKTQWLYAAVVAVVLAGLAQADNAAASPTQTRQKACTSSVTQTRTRDQLKTGAGTATATRTRDRLKDGSCKTK